MSSMHRLTLADSCYGPRGQAIHGCFKRILYEVCLNAPKSAKFPLTAMGLSPTLAPVPTASGRQYGEVSEWLKEHAWKVCIRQRIEGSNPSLTAIFKERACTQVRAFLLLYRASPGGMRSLDQDSTTGAARGTVCEPRELTARRVRPSGPNQSLPHRHIQRKSLYASTGFFAFISRQENDRCASLTCPTKPSVGWVSASAPTALPDYRRAPAVVTGSATRSIAIGILL